MYLSLSHLVRDVGKGLRHRHVDGDARRLRAGPIAAAPGVRVKAVQVVLLVL